MNQAITIIFLSDHLIICQQLIVRLINNKTAYQQLGNKLEIKIKLMIKDYFQKNIQLKNELRSEQFKAHEYLQKGKYRMKQKFFGGGKKHYDFDMNSQQYFHQYTDDVIFQTTEIQDQFMNYVTKSMQNTLRQPTPVTHHFPQPRNPYEARLHLAQHFANRVNDLSYKKYLTLLRVHNCLIQEELPVIRSRVLLIEKQIQSGLNRQARLKSEDLFEESFTLGGKPVPVNENGQPIYKYLQEDECWFSNITREDIIVYTRRKLYIDSILQQKYWPIHYELKNLNFIYGINILNSIEEDLAERKNVIKLAAEKQALQFVSLAEAEVQKISPGNLIEKENISEFIFQIFGINNTRFLHLPLYPAMIPELLTNVNKTIPIFFQNLTVPSHYDLITLLPKFNTFCFIIFKYQNKEILEGKKVVKLGLDDDVNVRKELITMLEELWVRKHISFSFNRFDYKMYIKSVDWPHDSISIYKKVEEKHQNQIKVVPDAAIDQLIYLVSLTDYNTFRKHMKKRSIDIQGRIATKYYHMQQVREFNKKSNETITMDNLNQLYKTKLQEDKIQGQILKPNSMKFFDMVIERNLITNPAEIEVVETLKCIQIRQIRTRIINILNGMRCYHRNICLDLRVMGGKKFDFQLDDNFLINSNKQTLENFQKAVKETQTYYSKNSGEDFPKISQQDFLIQKTLHTSMMYKKDMVRQEFYGGDIPHILVSDGDKPKNNIIYSIVLEDLSLIEDKIRISTTNYIHRYERLIKARKQGDLVDRVDVLNKIYECQQKYLYEKLKLIESYYKIYEMTGSVLQAFKIGKTIVEIVHERLQIDIQQESFQESYNLATEELNNQNKSVTLFGQILLNYEHEINKVFHEKFSRNNKIPLTLYAYIYGDMELKIKNVNRLSRMNSVVSLKSKTSKQDTKKLLDVKKEIKEEFGEQSSEQGNFDIAQYDQYLLQKDMDAIFEDMVQNQDKDNAPVNTISMENLTVNPRFEGGPHPNNVRTPKIKLTSTFEQYMLNFSEVMCWASNIRPILNQLKKQFVKRYGHCSQIYFLEMGRTISSYMVKIIMQPEKLPKKWHQFKTDDPYSQVVTSCMKYYEEIMAPALDPPQQAQILVQNMLKLHQDKLPGFSSLQSLDFHSIKNLALLKRPSNTVNYKELMLGINFIEFIELKQKLWHTQLERKRISRSYKILGGHCDLNVEKYGMAYLKNGSDQIFLSVQQLKALNSELIEYPVFPDSVQQLRKFVQCQAADLQLYKTIVDIAKISLQDVIIMKYQVGKQYVNGRLDQNRLISFDSKNIKLLKTRLNNLVSSLGTARIKNNSFFKLKSKIRIQFQRNMEQIKQYQLDTNLLGQHTKLNVHCQSLLQDKYKQLLINSAIQAYIEDLTATKASLDVIIDLEKCLSELRIIVNSIPYLSTIYKSNSQSSQLEKSVLYDQKQPKFQLRDYQTIIKEGQINDIFYIYSREQIIQEWNERDHSAIVQSSVQFTTRMNISLDPPTNKDLLFQWIFRVNKNSIGPIEKEATRHFLKIIHPYTGTLSQTYYSPNTLKKASPPRNKFLTFLQHFQAIRKYLEANILLVSLQLDQDIFDSLHRIMVLNRDFEKTFPQVDQTVPFQSRSTSVIAPCFVHEAKLDEINEHLKNKMEGRNYSEKKQHWVVLDEVTDFLVSKVQGFGVLRQSFLPLVEELNEIKVNKKDCKKYMQSRTKLIYNLLWLSFWQTYKQDSTANKSDFHNYLIPGLNIFYASKKVELFKSFGDTNFSIDIKPEINTSQLQKERFKLKVYQPNLRSIVNKIKSVYMSIPIDLQSFMIQQMARIQNISMDKVQNTYLYDDFASQRKFLQSMGSTNRFKLYGRIRIFNDRTNSYLAPKSQNISLNQRQILRVNYSNFMIQTQLQMIAGISFDKGLIDYSVNAIQSNFKSKFMQIHEVINMNAFMIYQKLDNYLNTGKIQFTKSQNSLIGKNQSGAQKQYNIVIREVIYNKLLISEIISMMLIYSINCLKLERLPQNQPKKIINTSLIPRVHLIASYSSPLIVDRKTYISQQYKLAFVQAFTNRFRNKVSRVDLLSSGYGFVITVPDLQDCLNFMNKLIFTFTQKQFKHRLQTFSQYYQILIEALKTKNKKILDQESIIQFLKMKQSNLLQAQYLGKVSKLLMQKTIIEDRLKEVERNSQGLQDRVRKVVQLQYNKKIQGIQNQNQNLKKQFDEFKKIFIILTKDATKNNFLNVMNNLKQKVSQLLNKPIDLSLSFQDIQQYQTKVISKIKVNQELHSQPNYQENHNEYARQDIQKCKIGEDIIHDPYYTTKLINKMRLFNVFKMGCKKIKFENQQMLKNKEYAGLQKIQDTAITQSERQNLMRKQLIKTQQELSKKIQQLEQNKQNCENLENQKNKLKIIITSKEKKIEQKERQIQDLKKMTNSKPEIEKQVTRQENGSERLQSLPKVNAAREKEHKRSIQKKLDKLSFITYPETSQEGLTSIYEKFQLSNKDSTWRQKCQQLYIQNKRLKQELEKVHQTITPSKQANSVNMRQTNRSMSSGHQVQTPLVKDNRKKFPNLAFKYSIMKQSQNPSNT